MGIFDDTDVTVVLADYASADSTGKVNMIGAAFSLAPPRGAGGSRPEQYVTVIVDVAASRAGEQFSFCLELHDDTAGVVCSVPGERGPEALRVQQLLTVNPLPAGQQWPASMWQRHIQCVGIREGMVLTDGHIYSWRVTIDGQSREHWRARFYAFGPPPPPVVGGPVQPHDPELPTL